MEADENSVASATDIDFVSVAAEFQCGAICLERVLVGKFLRAAMADEVCSPATFHDPFVSPSRFVRALARLVTTRSLGLRKGECVIHRA
jgi:hypothetical protein